MGCCSTRETAMDANIQDAHKSVHQLDLDIDRDKKLSPEERAVLKGMAADAKTAINGIDFATKYTETGRAIAGIVNENNVRLK